MSLTYSDDVMTPIIDQKNKTLREFLPQLEETILQHNIVSIMPIARDHDMSS
jgi:hypothetical protein